MAAFVKGKLKAARDALTKKDFEAALSASREVLSFESTNYNACVSPSSSVQHFLYANRRTRWIAYKNKTSDHSAVLLFHVYLDLYSLAWLYSNSVKTLSVKRLAPLHRLRQPTLRSLLYHALNSGISQSQPTIPRSGPRLAGRFVFAPAPSSPSSSVILCVSF